MKKALLTLGLLLVTNYSIAQCLPIIFPRINDTASGDGGKFCLQGSPSTANPNRDICFENKLGQLRIFQKDFASSLSSTELPKLILRDSELVIQGPNNPANYSNTRDLSFDFHSAGSARIRASRGPSWDTYLQFLTNPYDGNGTPPNLNDPLVRMHIAQDGKIGIGTTIPTQQLHVKENIKLEGSFIKFAPVGDAIVNRETIGNLMLNANGGENAVFINYGGNLEYQSNAIGGLKLFDGGNTNFANFWITRGQSVTPNAIEREAGNLVISPTGVRGRVIIADKTNTGLSIPHSTATSSNYKLIVQNGILTEKVKVAVQNATNWSDHVFENDYKLKPLDEVEKYINENNHLPNIPSSEELVRDGMDLGEMQAKQMEKIEELTLYMIEMKKEIEGLKKENAELKEKVSTSKN